MKTTDISAENKPLVSCMIATRNRPEELLQTLQQLRQLKYPYLEVIVVDDASTEPIEPLVRSIWPEARVIRHECNAGQCQRRNEGFQLSRGEYILHLDDDCCFTVAGDLERAVRILDSRPHAAALAPYLFNGPVLPSTLPTKGLVAGYIASFVGAAVLIRTSAVRATYGYRAFFGNEWEEEELCLQLLHAGLGVWFEPSLVAHHRLSTLNRNSGRTWMRGLRNRCWAILMHMPWHRVPLELSWKIALGGWDAVRLGRPLLYIRSLWECVLGTARALRLRRPLSSLATRRYDSVRIYPCISEATFVRPAACVIKDVGVWWQHWRNRARDRNRWDIADGGVGQSYTAGYAHEKRNDS